MHANTIAEHDALKHQAHEIAYAWKGTDPMRSVDEVRQALSVDGEPDDLQALLPYVVDACREAGLLSESEVAS